MSEQPPSWEDLRRGPQQPASATAEFDEACAHVFTSAAGKRLMKELRRRFVEAPFSPSADERALRVRATQQHFVRDLEIACDRGIAARAKRKET